MAAGSFPPCSVLIPAPRPPSPPVGLAPRFRPSSSPRCWRPCCWPAAAFSPPPPANALVDGDSRGSGPGDFLPGPLGQGGGQGDGDGGNDDSGGGPEQGGAVGQDGAVGQNAQAQSYTATLSVSEVTDTWAWLNIVGNTSTWYYKGDQSGATCTEVTTIIRNPTAENLTPGTEYTYTAYSNDTCTTQLSNSVTFTTATPTLAVRHLNDTTATLTLRNHNTGNGDWHYKANAGPHNSCADAGSAHSAFLTGLSPGASYTYAAYKDTDGDGDCDSSDKLDETTFTTLAAPLPECDHLTLDRHIFERNNSYQFQYIVGNRTDEPLTNVKADFRVDDVINDVRTRGSSKWYPVGSTNTYVLDGVKLRPSPFLLYKDTIVGATSDGAFWFWEPFATRSSTGSRGYMWHWLLNLPAGSSSAVRVLPQLLDYGWGRGSMRFHLTVEHSAPPTGEPFCRTERVEWLDGTSSSKVNPMSQDYQVVGITADDPYPAAGGAVNFTVSVDATGGVFNLNARVRHTPGLEFQPNQSPVITPAPKTSSPARTVPLGVWQNYDAASGTGDFYIGTEDKYERYKDGDLHGVEDFYHDYTITLPLKLKAGAKASEQCVTATVTASPETPQPYTLALGPLPFDDPSDNTKTLCLGVPDTSEGPPLFQHGDHVDLLSLYFCDGITKQTGWEQDPTTHPCTNTQATDLGVELATEHLADGNWRVYSAPANQVNAVVKLDPVESATVDTTWQSVNTWCDATQNVTNTNCTGGKGVWVQNSSRISFATARDVRDHHNEVVGHTHGPQLHWTVKRMDGQFSNWGTMGRLMSVSGLPDGGFSAIPDQYGTTCITVNNNQMPAGLDTLVSKGGNMPDPPGGMNYRGPNFVEFRQRPPEAKDYWSDLNRPRHKRWNWTITNITYDNNSYERIAEFTNLGTYVVDYHYSLTRSSGAARYCDTLRTVFHVGPIAELSVADRGPVPALSSGQAAYTLDLTNHGPDAAESAKVVVELPAGATGVATVPANLGTFLAADANATPARDNAYWTWDAGVIGPAGPSRGAGVPQNRAVSLIVSGVTSGDATATVSNGNYYCKGPVGVDLSYVTSEADCKKVTNATWTPTNPYKLCLAKDHNIANRFLAAYPTPASQTDCETGTGNKWFEGTVLDHRQGNNTATLTARTGGAGLSGASASNPSMVLNWPAAAGALEYRIFRSPDGTAGSYRQIARVGKDTLTYTDEAVSNGVTYHYQVEALYASRMLADVYAGPLTATLKVSTPRAPGSVSGLTAARQSNNDNAIDVTWTAPSNATAATRYDVQYQSRTGNSGNYGDWTAAATEQGGLAYTITGAGGGTSYRIQVRAVNVVGTGSYPGGWSTASVSPLANPKLVGSLTAARDTGNLTNINVTWNPPSDGTTPTSYEVEYRENGVAWPNPPTDHGVTYTCDTSTPVVCTFQLTGAAGASTYQFRVRTVTVSGNDTIYGSWNNSSTVSRVSAPNQVTGLTAGRKSDDETKIDVSWTAPSGGTTPTGYEAEYRVNGSGDWLTTNLTVPGTTAQLTGAAGNSTYQFRVRAFKTLTTTSEKLMGSWRTSGTVSRVGVPNRVTGLTATRSATDETKITVAWTAPSSGDTPTGYDVEYKQDGGSDWTTGATVTHPAVTHTFTVEGGSSYQYRVRAFRTLTSTSEKLAGSWTTSSTVRALPAGPVTNLAATRNTTDATTIDVSWSASNRATGYDVQYRKNSGSWQWAVRASDQTAITENPTETFNYTQTDAGGVESYQFRVRGVSGVGNGDWAESGTVAPPPVGYHGAEVGPQVADGKMAWIKLKVTSGPWSFEYRNHLGDWSSCKNVASGSYTISNLRAPHQHIVEVFDGNGCSDAAKITRTNVYTIDVQDPILDGADFNYHTHKRPYPSMGEVGVKPSDCLSIEQHSHGWPGGGGGTHWHCPIYNAGSSSGATGQTGQPSGGAQGETQPTGLAAVMAAINAYFNGTGTLAEAYAALQSYYG